MEMYNASHIAFVFSSSAISALARLMGVHSIHDFPAAADDDLFLNGCDELEQKGCLRYAGDRPAISETIGFLMSFLVKPETYYIIKSKNEQIRVYALPGVFCLTDEFADGILRIMPLQSSRDVVLTIDQLHKQQLMQVPIEITVCEGGNARSMEMDYYRMIDSLTLIMAQYDELQ